MSKKKNKTIKKIFRIIKNSILGEVEEVKLLTPTQRDYAQAEILADAAIAAMTSLGLPYSALSKTIIAKVFAYGIRDAKDGLKDKKKLIISRVVEEIKNEQKV